MPAITDWNKKIDKEKFAPAFAKWDFGWLNVPELIEKQMPYTNSRWLTAILFHNGHLDASHY